MLGTSLNYKANSFNKDNSPKIEVKKIKEIIIKIFTKNGFIVPIDLLNDFDSGNYSGSLNINFIGDGSIGKKYTKNIYNINKSINELELNNQQKECILGYLFKEIIELEKKETKIKQLFKKYKIEEIPQAIFEGLKTGVYIGEVDNTILDKKKSALLVTPTYTEFNKNLQSIKLASNIELALSSYFLEKMETRLITETIFQEYELPVPKGLYDFIENGEKKASFQPNFIGFSYEEVKNHLPRPSKIYNKMGELGLENIFIKKEILAYFMKSYVTKKSIEQKLKQEQKNKQKGEKIKSKKETFLGRMFQKGKNLFSKAKNFFSFGNNIETYTDKNGKVYEKYFDITNKKSGII